VFLNNLTNKLQQRFFNNSSSLKKFPFEKRYPVLLFLFTLLVTPKLFAAAGDSVSATATINYIVAGAPNGDTATAVFIEDRRINFNVSESNGGEAVQVISDEQDAVLQFTITNTSNSTHDFLLTAVNTSPNPFGLPVDNIDPLPGTIQVFSESGVTPGYQAAEDIAVYVDELASNQMHVVYVISDMPTANEDDVAAIALIAQAAEGGAANAEGAAISADDNARISPAGVFSNGATVMPVGVSITIPDDVNTMETVFNDPAGLMPEDISTDLNQDIAGNGQHSDASAYRLIPPVKITKAVTVIDTVGGSDPHAGATLRYELVVTVAGNSSVSDLIINDAIPDNTIYSDGSITLNAVVQTDADDNPVDFSKAIDITAKPVTAIEIDLSQGGTVSVTPGDTHTINFEVTIK